MRKFPIASIALVALAACNTSSAQDSLEILSVPQLGPEDEEAVDAQVSVLRQLVQTDSGPMKVRLLLANDREPSWPKCLGFFFVAEDADDGSATFDATTYVVPFDEVNVEKSLAAQSGALSEITLVTNESSLIYEYSQQSLPNPRSWPDYELRTTRARFMVDISSREAPTSSNFELSLNLIAEDRLPYRDEILQSILKLSSVCKQL